MEPKAYKIVRERGRAYLYKGKYPQLTVFTKSVTELDILIQTFGGHSYKHKCGYVWLISRRSQIKKLMAKIMPCQSRHGIESILQPDGDD